MKQISLTVALVAFGLTSAFGADENPQAADEAAIRQAVEAYVAAFNQKDAPALAALWSPEAVYTNPVSGEQVVGREAIEEQFAAIFADEEPVQLKASTQDVKFVSPNVAVEQGTAAIMRPDQEPEETEYTAVYVKREGKWLLDRVTEEDVPVIVSNYEHLKPLEWMIGTWVDQDDQAVVETTCQWTKNRNYITRSFTLSVRDRLEIAGMQIVGWDPAAKQIRSWVFDSDGGFGEGVWTQKDKAWHIAATGTAQDGSRSSALNIITFIDDNTFTWQSINRQAGGELLPNVDEVVVVRQPEAD